jgi:hypothetical protein
MTQPAIEPDLLDLIRELEPSRNAQPVERLLLAVLQQAVLDYFTGNEPLQRDALRYFRESVLYRLTLQIFDLPRDTLPRGVLLDEIPERPLRVRSAARHVAPKSKAISLDMMEEIQLNRETISLLTLMQTLKGNRLHIFLTVHLLAQPVSIADVVDISGISEDTVRRQMMELQAMGLLTKTSPAGAHKSWIVSRQAAKIITGQPQ